MKGLLLAEVDRLWDEQIDLLRRLVAEPSVRGNTNGVQQIIAHRMRTYGMQVVEEGIDVESIRGLPGFSLPEWSYDGLFNVVGRLSGGGRGKSLLLNGHIDVVSAEPVAHWTRDPWTAAITNGRMYGRGVCDMKSGISSMLIVAQALHNAGIELGGDLVLETVIDEECGGNGTLSCLERGHVADAAIVPEPTGLGVISAHPGILWFRVEVRGQGAHAQSASGAVNAAEKMFPIIAGLRTLEAELNRAEKRHDALASLDHPINLNIGTLHAGDWPSNVPELCVMEARLAYYPGQDLREAQQLILDSIQAAGATDPWLSEHPAQVTFFGFNAEPAIYDLDTPIFHILEAEHDALVGVPLVAAPSAATIDNRFFQLYYDIPTVVYGATGGALHAPDEWLDLESLRLSTRVLAATVLAWCGTA